jgi:hypothetical protein
MAEFSRFFGSAVGDTREYNQVEFAEVLSNLLNNGYFKDKGDEFETTQSTPPALSVDVKSGEAWINGYWYKSDATETLTISPPDTVNDRKDLIVLRLDVITARLITLQVKTGTPSSSPVVPTLQQDTQIWEIPIAIVTVPANAITITNANIEFRSSVVFGDLSATLLSTGWTGSAAPFEQTIQVIGLCIGEAPIIDIDLTGTFATDIEIAENWAKVYRVVTGTNQLTAYATEAPTVNIPLKIKVVK